jgi:thiamine biosynthesis protein ThiS
MSAAPEVFINGEPREIGSGQTLASLITELGLNPTLVAVEIDRELVRKSSFDERLLAGGERIEIVEFVGGG